MGKRSTFYLLVSTGCMLILGCSRQSVEPEMMHPIRLHLKYASAPDHPSLFVPAGFQNTRLAKSTRLVQDQVLLLHCDDESLTVASDATEYNNDFYLNYVEYDSSATPQLQKALVFGGDPTSAFYSYGISESYGSAGGVFNGTHGLEISFYMYITNPDAYGEQRLIDRHDEMGGYTIGINYFQPFFRIKQNGTIVEAVGKTTLRPLTWYKVTARFDQANLTLQLDDNPVADATVPATGTITPSTRATVIGAGWNGDLIGYGFTGRMDEISIISKVEYEDFERIRLAVIDLSSFANEYSFYDSEAWRNYWHDMQEMTIDTTFIPTWESYRQLWGRHFDVVSESDLSVNGAFAEGTIRGVEGVNLLAVAGIQGNRITYSGEGFVAVGSGEVADAYVEIWPWQIEGGYGGY